MPDTGHIVMSHPGLPDADPVRVPRLQFEVVWSALGWVEASTTAKPRKNAPARVATDSKEA
ncbi:hypothetical protein ACFC08_35525 [Streptomyces sp. NPDC056112]|uniref:hypothetical protein n=1 Tax=Streptomyces sp. NPDC056112 TaxID=3345715 RepID=UPI0035DF623F